MIYTIWGKILKFTPYCVNFVDTLSNIVTSFGKQIPSLHRVRMFFTLFFGGEMCDLLLTIP